MDTVGDTAKNSGKQDEDKKRTSESGIVGVSNMVGSGDGDELKKECKSEDDNKNITSAKGCNRPVPQPTKRRPDKELNHENWDQEDEPEEKGEFKKASEDKLKERKILTAKRKQAAQPSSNPFGSITFTSAFGGPPNPHFPFTSNVKSQVPAFDFTGLSSASPVQGDHKQTKSVDKKEVDTEDVKSKVVDSGKESTDSPKTEESATVETKTSQSNNTGKARPALQPTKRRPDKQLTHENWDEEDEPEEKGEFKKASEAQLKERKFLTAKRKQPSSQSSSNPFVSAFGGIGNSSGNALPAFNFSTNAQLPVPAFDFSGMFPTPSGEAAAHMNDNTNTDNEKDDADNSSASS